MSNTPQPTALCEAIKEFNRLKDEATHLMDKLIYDFMHRHDRKDTFIPSGLKLSIPDYDSWDNLMPVIENIRKDLGFNFSLISSGADWSATIGEIRAPYYLTAINAAKAAVVYFIEWYNNRLTNQTTQQ